MTIAAGGGGRPVVGQEREGSEYGYAYDTRRPADVGAHAGGKSNLVKALHSMRGVALETAKQQSQTLAVRFNARIDPAPFTAIHTVVTLLTTLRG